MNTEEKCLIKKCDKYSQARGLCSSCYSTARTMIKETKQLKRIADNLNDLIWVIVMGVFSMAYLILIT